MAAPTSTLSRGIHKQKYKISLSKYSLQEIESKKSLSEFLKLGNNMFRDSHPSKVLQSKLHRPAASLRSEFTFETWIKQEAFIECDNCKDIIGSKYHNGHTFTTLPAINSNCGHCICLRCYNELPPVPYNATSVPCPVERCDRKDALPLDKPVVNHALSRAAERFRDIEHWTHRELININNAVVLERNDWKQQVSLNNTIIDNREKEIKVLQEKLDEYHHSEEMPEVTYKAMERELEETKANLKRKDQDLQQLASKLKEAERKIVVLESTKPSAKSKYAYDSSPDSSVEVVEDPRKMKTHSRFALRKKKAARVSIETCRKRKALLESSDTDSSVEVVKKKQVPLKRSATPNYLEDTSSDDEDLRPVSFPSGKKNNTMKATDKQPAKNLEKWFESILESADEDEEPYYDNTQDLFDRMREIEEEEAQQKYSSDSSDNY